MNNQVTRAGLCVTPLIFTTYGHAFVFFAVFSLFFFGKNYSCYFNKRLRYETSFLRVPFAEWKETSEDELMKIFLKDKFSVEENKDS